MDQHEITNDAYVIKWIKIHYGDPQSPDTWKQIYNGIKESIVARPTQLSKVVDISRCAVKCLYKHLAAELWSGELWSFIIHKAYAPKVEFVKYVQNKGYYFCPGIFISIADEQLLLELIYSIDYLCFDAIQLDILHNALKHAVKQRQKHIIYHISEPYHTHYFTSLQNNIASLLELCSQYIHECEITKTNDQLTLRQKGIDLFDYTIFFANQYLKYVKEITQGTLSDTDRMRFEARCRYEHELWDFKPF